MKGYLAGQLLCSLVSPDFQTLQMEGIPPQLERSWGRTAQRGADQGHSSYKKCLSVALHKSLVSILFMCVSVLCFTEGSQSNVIGKKKSNFSLSSKTLCRPADQHLLSESYKSTCEANK